MPTGTKVDEVYEALLAKGYSKAKAARIAQSQTGDALATGRPPKHPVAAANEVEAAMPPPKKRRGGPEYALAAANDEEAAQMIRPSSERTTEAKAATEAPASGNGFSWTPKAPKTPAAAPAAAPASEQAATPTPTRPEPTGDPRLQFINRLIGVGYTPEDAETKATKVLAGKTPEQIADHARWAENIPDSYLAPGGVTGRTHKQSVRESINARQANRRFANEAPAEDLTTPSSERTTLSPGNQVLKELREDRVQRQAVVKPLDKTPAF